MNKILITLMLAIGLSACGQEPKQTKLSCNVQTKIQDLKNPLEKAVSWDTEYLIKVNDNTIDFVWTYNPEADNGMNFSAKIIEKSEGIIKFVGNKKWVYQDGRPALSHYEGSVNRFNGNISWSVQEAGYYDSMELFHGPCSTEIKNKVL